MPKILIPEAVDAYAQAHSAAEPEACARLASETRAAFPDRASMMLGPLGGATLRMLVRMIGARRVLEIGTFTGYSTLWIAEGLPEGGVVYACDRDEAAMAVARRYFDESPRRERIRPILGDAAASVAALEGPFDLVFLDADKEDYPRYWELVVPKVRPGGVIVADNTLWYGAVFDPRQPSDHGVVAFNRLVRDDRRVSAVMLTVRDGMTVAIKE